MIVPYLTPIMFQVKLFPTPLICIICFLATMLSFALPATAQARTDKSIQPSIMVIPYVRKGEDIRTVLENDINRRVTIAKVKEGFDDQSLKTIDFIAKMKELERSGAFTSGSQSDMKTLIIEYSGADIYVEVETHLYTGSGGSSIRIILTAYDAGTASSLADKTLRSNEFYTDKVDLLIENALNASISEEDDGPSILSNFVATIKEKLNEIAHEGRSVKLVFSVEKNVPYNYATETGTDGSQLRELIEAWIAAHAHNNYYHPPAGTPLRVIYDDVRIPLRDSKGIPYSPSRFAAELSKYCSTLTRTDNMAQGWKMSYDINGNTIHVRLK